MLFKRMRKRYWKKAIVYGKGIPHTCDGMMPVLKEAKSLFTDDEWDIILEERKKYLQELQNLIDDLEQ